MHMACSARSPVATGQRLEASGRRELHSSLGTWQMLELGAAGSPSCMPPPAELAAATARPGACGTPRAVAGTDARFNVCNRKFKAFEASPAARAGKHTYISEPMSVLCHRRAPSSDSTHSLTDQMHELRIEQAAGLVPLGAKRRRDRRHPGRPTAVAALLPIQRPPQIASNVSKITTCLVTVMAALPQPARWPPTGTAVQNQGSVARWPLLPRPQLHRQQFAAAVAGHVRCLRDRHTTALRQWRLQMLPTARQRGLQ